jgi:hypothetical protein
MDTVPRGSFGLRLKGKLRWVKQGHRHIAAPHRDAARAKTATCGVTVLESCIVRDMSCPGRRGGGGF